MSGIQLLRIGCLMSSLVSRANSRIIIGMMARDEESRLEAWILYHARLVGFENLYIFDNGSMSQKVKNILRMYEKRGVKIDRNHGGKEDFTKKGEISTELFKRLENDMASSFFVPLDCDEFISLREADGLITIDPRKIYGYFDSLGDMQCTLVARDAYANILGCPGCFFPAYQHHKIFFPSGACKLMDEGFHTTLEGIQGNRLETSITYLHFHYRPFEDMQKQSKWKLENQLDISDFVALKRYKGPGHHVVPFLSMSKNDYMNGFKVDSGEGLRVENLVPYLKSIGIGNEFFSSI